MTDYTSSLYLGMKHSSDELKGWKQLTTGLPAILLESALSRQVGNTVAQMQGLEKGVSAPSTLHLYWDLFGLLTTWPVILFIDEHVYPVSRYGIEKLASHKIPVIPFRHFDADHLASLLKKHNQAGSIPVIITDSWCPVCGAIAPLQQYAKLVKRNKGIVVVDDTQAFGILGGGKKSIIPYGCGGGGSLPWLRIRENNLVTMVSLAKGFGAPLSVLSGNDSFIRQFITHSETRVNSSPVSMAHLQAAANAFRINREQGDQLRQILWQNIRAWQEPLQKAGVPLYGGIFPMQTIRYKKPAQTMGLYQWLKGNKSNAVLVTPHGAQDPALAVLFRSDHTPEQVQSLARQVIRYHLSIKQATNVNTLTGNTTRRGSAQTASRLYLRP